MAQVFILSLKSVKSPLNSLKSVAGAGIGEGSVFITDDDV